MKWFKREELNVEKLENDARRLSNEYSEIIVKYDERTEEMIDLLREKNENLYDCKKYYDMASDLKEEVRKLKVEKSEKQQEINILKRGHGEISDWLLSSNSIIKPQDINDYETFISYLKTVQYSDEELLPMRNIIAAVKRLKVDLNDIEEKDHEMYKNLNMKNWEV